jgi:anti-sigma B factor antagonist
MAPTSHQREATTVVRRDGEIDLVSAHDFGLELLRAIDLGHPTVIVDLTEVEFIDSAGAHVLLNARALAQSAGIEFVLRKPRDTAAQALDICGL